MRVTILSTVGDHQQGETIIAAGSTVSDVCINCLGVDPATKELAIRLNGQQSSVEAVLQEGDRVTIAPQKIANA